MSPSSITNAALTACMNMCYYLDHLSDGMAVVRLKKRQGTELISASAIDSPILACTYYYAGKRYVIATESKLYELDDDLEPSELGSLSGIPTFTEFNGKLIIHDGAVTKCLDGTDFALLNSYYKDEILGTGNNSTTNFSGTLDNPVVEAGTLVITYTDGTTKTLTDQGDGTLTGDGTGTIVYSTGAWTIACSGAPDNTTSIYAEYEKVGGAPKSKAGFVRASRLYMWGDSDNASRIWYSGPNDAEDWGGSSGGYIDVDALDGQTLVGCLNYFSSIIVMKENSLHRIDNFPGDTDFAVQPLMDNTGALAYRTCLNDGNVISFLSKQGWIGLTSTSAFGDIAKSDELSANFRGDAIKYATSNCYAEYNQLDHQLWLSVYNGTVQQPYVYVVSLDTGKQLSLYKFAFGHTCYKFVNDEMLIGGSDGNLYRLYSGSFRRYDDNSVSYSSDTMFKTAATNWGVPFNRKHNKKFFVHAYGESGMTATVNIYKDGSYFTPIYTGTIALGTSDIFIYGDDEPIYGDTGLIAEDRYSENNQSIPCKFNYSEVMVEVTDIDGSNGAEFAGIDFTGAILGGRLNGDF